MILPTFRRFFRAVSGERKSSTYLASHADSSIRVSKPIRPRDDTGPPRTPHHIGRIREIQDQRIGNITRRDRSRRMAHHVYRQMSKGGHHVFLLTTLYGGPKA